MLVEKVKLGILEACICKKYIKEKSGEKVKLFVFEVRILPQKMHFLFKFTGKCSIYSN